MKPASPRIRTHRECDVEGLEEAVSTQHREGEPDRSRRDLHGEPDPRQPPGGVTNFEEDLRARDDEAARDASTPAPPFKLQPKPLGLAPIEERTIAPRVDQHLHMDGSERASESGAEDGAHHALTVGGVPPEWERVNERHSDPR